MMTVICVDPYRLLKTILLFTQNIRTTEEDLEQILGLYTAVRPARE